tara:strand:+ start:6295 stop:7461 length:1167 start_codon:yes stop_codon:yes gene_type:complete
MKKDIIILGSTGSIGSTTLSIINKKFKIKLLSTNKNIKKILKQAIDYNVKNVVIEDKNNYLKFKSVFKKKNIRLHLGVKNIDSIIKKKVSFCVNAISGIDGLEPTLKIIPLTENILIANKESIICGWNFINVELKKNKTNFIPIDSEHFSIWKLLQNSDVQKVNKIILTASGGPFLNISKRKILNVKPNIALKHPNWKMGKKITIDSSNMMNKIFEYIEAKKIFNLKKNKISILIHPTSFIHAIIYFKGDLIKFLAHDTQMKVPISNALGLINDKRFNISKHHLENLNNIKVMLPDKKKFPLLSLINLIPEKTSYFETILITLNDSLVYKYLDGKINYISIQKNLLNIIKKPYFSKYYKLKPKNIYDIKNMIKTTENYLNDNIEYYET